MNIIVIGDIHGRSIWKKIADLDLLFSSINDPIIPKYDKYIFLGDYVDTHDVNIKPVEIINNLEELICLAKTYPENIVLLSGNHDNQYIFGYHRCGCSGFNSNIYHILNKLFNDNIELFKPIYNIQNYIFSHAGITKPWLDEFNIYHKVKENTICFKTIEESFSEKVLSPLFNVGRIRGGNHKYGGPFWADADETLNPDNYLANYIQVVGHTPMKRIITVEFNENSKITYCDVLSNYDLPIEEYYLELTI